MRISGNHRFLADVRVLVCEEKAPQIVQQGDAANPLVIECKH